VSDEKQVKETDTNYSPNKPEADNIDGTPLVAPMPGMIVNYEKKIGDAVDEGETVVVLEAMKMEMPLVAPLNGIIKAINFNKGDAVAKNAILCVIG
jgi:pyruvate carboxylase subunit B